MTMTFIAISNWYGHLYNIQMDSIMNSQICRNISLLSTIVHASFYGHPIGYTCVQESKPTLASRTLKVVNVIYAAPWVTVNEM